MNFKLYWTMVKFAISQAPETALEIISNLRPDRWQMSIDGSTSGVSHGRPTFNVRDSYKKRVLVLEMGYATMNADGSAQQHGLVAGTLFRNDGSDELAIDGEAMIMASQGFDLDTKPFRRDARVQIRFTTPSGEDHIIELSNKF